MKLRELLKRVPYTLVQGDLDTEVTGISHDTREINEGDLFLCINGTRFDSHTLINEIIEKGAGAIVIEKSIDECPKIENKDIPIIQIENERVAEGPLAAEIYENPAFKLKTIGITGSKGKTTVTHMLGNILKESGAKVGIIGTNGFIIDDNVTELANTTPSAIEVQRYLKEMVDNDVDYAIIECSSQGLMMGRLDGFDFDIGVFLNIAEGDHIGPNEHKDFEEYLHSKGLLIKNSSLGLVNRDDKWTEEMLEDIDTPIVFFGQNNNSDYYLKDFKKTFDHGMPGQEFEIEGKLKGEFPVNLPGDFNVQNAMVAAAIANELGIDSKFIGKALNNLNISGRFDIVYNSDDLTICVDFAHNGLSTRNHLEALREYKPKRLVCVFGADGNRSKDRRYGMGEASGRLADYSIITSGHNRWETFDEILKDIKVGIGKTDGEYIAIPDRKEAIRYAIENSKPGDFITILGLGHEHYQEENGVKYPYSDIDYVNFLVEELNLK